jgi:predicted naringenin-chalcone synthase
LQDLHGTNFAPPLHGFLARHCLALDDLDGVILHSGGRKVLEAIEDASNCLTKR